MVVGLAEIGDKTQILSLMFAARFQRPVPILFGILLATLANHAAAGLAGTLRAYRAIQRFDPSARYPLLDDLMSIEKRGKLQKYVEKRTKCVED